jgi:hypothetical protein
MQNLLKQVDNLFSIENTRPQESTDSLVIKKHFLNFQIHKLVQLQSELEDCLRELDVVDSEISSLNTEFSKEFSKVEQELKRDKLKLSKKLKSDICDFLQNVTSKNEQDAKADQMAKVSFLGI